MTEGKPKSKPASKMAVENLVLRKLEEGDELLNDDNGCVICLECWGVEEIITEMPCKHRFHGECLKSWLSCQNTCPICRHEIEAEVVREDSKDSNGSEGEGESGENNDGGTEGESSVTPSRSTLPNLPSLGGGSGVDDISSDNSSSSSLSLSSSSSSIPSVTQGGANQTTADLHIANFNNTIDDLSERRHELWSAFTMDIQNSDTITRRVMHVVSPGTAGDTMLLSPGGTQGLDDSDNDENAPRIH